MPNSPTPAAASLPGQARFLYRGPDRRKAKQTLRSYIQINRAPVLTLWAAVVAERLGFKRDEALTFGRAVAGMNAYAKGRSLGLLEPGKSALAEKRKTLKTGREIEIVLLNRAIPATRSGGGLRALSKGKPIDPKSVDTYLKSKFGDGLADTRAAMRKLAKCYSPASLATQADSLYDAFRPAVPAGTKGWGAKGRLSLGKIASLAAKAEGSRTRSNKK